MDMAAFKKWKYITSTPSVKKYKSVYITALVIWTHLYLFIEGVYVIVLPMQEREIAILRNLNIMFILLLQVCVYYKRHGRQLRSAPVIILPIHIHSYSKRGKTQQIGRLVVQGHDHKRNSRVVFQDGAIYSVANKVVRSIQSDVIIPDIIAIERLACGNRYKSSCCLVKSHTEHTHINCCTSENKQHLWVRN